MNAPTTSRTPRPSSAETMAGAAIILPPVVERELRVALHRRGARDLRLKVARYGVIGVSLFMLFGALLETAAWGRTLQFYLFLAGLSMAAGPALQMSVGLFAEERRQQTLELLYLAGMGSVELFVGKLLGGALVCSSELLALAPLMAVPFLSGGVSFELYVETATCLPTLFVFVLAIGSLASALSRQEGTALVITVVVIGVLCLALPLPYNLGSWLTGKAPFQAGWLALSPALGPWIIARNSGAFTATDFWRWTAVTWFWSFLCLAIAALALRRNWRRDLQRAAAEGWQKRWEALVLGSRSWREELRRRLLAVNAYQWLAQQDRRPVLQAWGLMIAVAGLWLLGWCAWPHAWLSPLNFYTTAMVLLLGLGWLTSQAAARRISADRRDGSLELLLTTPLSPKEILAGQQAALNDQFNPVKRGVSALLLLMVLGGIWTHRWTTQGVVSYLSVWAVLFAWCWRPAGRAAPMAMWIAANCGRPLYGVFRTGGAWNRIWIIYWFSMMANSLGAFGGFARSFPTGSTAEMLVCLAVGFWVLVVIYATQMASSSMAEPLVSQLRSIAQEPLPERNDPRFKEWKDIRKRFPAPADGRFEIAEETKPIKAAGAWLWRPLGRLCGIAWGRLSMAAKTRRSGTRG